MRYLIGTDIGTSGAKTVLFDENGTTVAESLYEYPLFQPQNGYAEQNPLDWWEAVKCSINQVLHSSGVNKNDVVSVGLSGQMHGLVMLDNSNNVIRPAIIWCDQRTAVQADYIEKKITREKLIEISANPAIAGFTAAKLLWVRENEPSNYDKCAHVLLPKDYIRFMLTGEYVTEVSDASGTQLLDVKNRCWSDYLFEKLDIDKNIFPRVTESQTVSGVLTKRAAEETGLNAGTLVVGGAGDQAAAAIGNGIVRQGVVSATIGTSGVVFAHTDSPLIDPLGRVHTMCHAVPNTWHIMGVTQGAGLSFKWFRDNFYQSEKEKYGDGINKKLDEFADKVPAGANGLMFLPYLMGERTPHLDSNARGVFFGLSAIHTREDLLRAVLEGVVFSLNDCMNIIKDMGCNTNTVFAGGGGGASSLWRQIMADVFDCDVSVRGSVNSGALGVAILAGVGAGVYSSVPEACDSIIKTKTKTEVDHTKHKVYNKYYKLYCDLYKSLKNDFRELSYLM